MNIFDTRLNDFLDKIELMKRNKINDYSFVEQFHYVDPNGYLAKLEAEIDHVVFGRRGSGKTTLLQKSITSHSKKNRCILIDCEALKKESEQDIIIFLIESIVEQIHKDIDIIEFRKAKRRKVLKTNVLSRFFVDKEEQKEVVKYYEDYAYILGASKFLLESMSRLKQIDETVEFDIEHVRKENKKVEESSENKVSFLSGTSVDAKVKESFLTLQTALSFSASGQYTTKSDLTEEESLLIKTQQRKSFRKKDIIDKLKFSIVKLTNTYSDVFDKHIIMFLDDFYYIQRSNQPYILNYIHQLNKICTNASFSFKLSALPNRFKMNYDGEFDLSIKDDFSAITLDRDLFEIKTTKEFLLDICSALCEKNISSREFEECFNSKEALQYAIISCGGNPRGFLVLLEGLIRKGRKNGSWDIGKTMIYSIVYDSIEEKEHSIEDDEIIPRNKVLELVGRIKREVVLDKNTNVFLYPQQLHEKHNYILKSLVSFGYIHQLKESIVSDYHGKKTFVPYCIDMSLYVTESAMKRRFNFCKFWERDNNSRLINIVKSPQWSLGEDFTL